MFRQLFLLILILPFIAVCASAEEIPTITWEHESCISCLAPEYTLDAAKARIQGSVILEVTVNESGTPQSIEVLKRLPLLTDAAVEAVNNWVISPIVSDGGEIILTYYFKTEFRMND